MARIEVLALIQTLNADLLSHDSATLTLDRWCDAHHLAAPAQVVAERVRDADKTATAELRELLHISATEPIRYRRVKLRCGDHVLSEADNWYVPARLPQDINFALETTDIAFGRAAQPLGFQRRTLSAKLLWSPLPDGWEMGAPVLINKENLEIPDALFEHRALLVLPDGVPFSTVIETYTNEILAFPEPHR